jgi:hypothetical protein
VDKLVYLLPPLSCAAMMAAMIWMMRGSNRRHTAPSAGGQPDPATQQQITALRTELAALRTAHTNTPAGDAVVPGVETTRTAR